MVAFEDKELAKWLEQTARNLLENNARSAAVVAILPEGKVFSGYLRSKPAHVAMYMMCMQQDAIMEMFENNRNVIRGILEGEEERGSV